MKSESVNMKRHEVLQDSDQHPGRNANSTQFERWKLLRAQGEQGKLIIEMMNKKQSLPVINMLTNWQNRNINIRLKYG